MLATTNGSESEMGSLREDTVPLTASEKFTRVPIRREENGALTVLCSIRGQPTHLLIDTGAFVTILHKSFAASLGLATEPTRISAQFAPGVPKRSAQQNSTTSPSARSKCRRKNLVSLRCLSSRCNKAIRKSPESSAWTHCTFATPSSISTA